MTGSKTDHSKKVRMMGAKDGEAKGGEDNRLWGVMPLINGSHLMSQQLVDGRLLRLKA